ncbi:MAG: hypothetical protein IKQ07_09225 [Bacteroidaceae bacterium]|nr:hypothetical protein [Bacteroidaceae bacterium]
MERKNFNIRLNLQAMNGAFLRNMTSSKTGVTKRCIIIPVDDNPSMYIGEKGTYLNAIAYELEQPKYDDTHMLKPDLPKEVREQMTAEQRQQVPAIGNMRPQKPAGQQVTGNVTATEEAQDDLPF